MGLKLLLLPLEDIEIQRGSSLGRRDIILGLPKTQLQRRVARSKGTFHIRHNSGIWVSHQLYKLGFLEKLFERLPNNFTAPLNERGDGELTLRYGCRRCSVIVRARQFRGGWRRFVRHAGLATGDILLGAYSGGDVVSFLRFRRGVGVRTAWLDNADAFDVDSELVEDMNLPIDVEDFDLDHAYMSGYFPPYMTLLFTFPCGVCVFKPYNVTAMRAPLNLAQMLYLRDQTTINIRSGDRVFVNVGVVAGHFQGPRWVTLVADCEIAIGFKLFFFLNEAEELEMIVIGADNAEVVYLWSRRYFRRI